MKGLDQIGCILQMLGWFPARGVGYVIKTFPFNEVEQSPILPSLVHLAIQDPIHFPLAGVIKLDWWWWVGQLIWDTAGTGRRV